MADAELADLADGGDGGHVEVGQGVAGVDLETQLPGKTSGVDDVAQGSLAGSIVGGVRPRGGVELDAPGPQLCLLYTSDAADDAMNV